MVQWMKRLGLLLAASAIVLMGCQGSLITYKGTTVRPASRIALPDGTDTNGRYRSDDLIIDYHAVRNGDALELSGAVQYSPGIRNSYTRISVFVLSVFLSDQEGFVLENKGIATPGSDDPDRKMGFHEKIQLPPGTANISFSYSGEARGGGGGIGSGTGGSMTSFWKIPIIR
jgi:hypothetical protein